jgi:hypothetical protein
VARQGLGFLPYRGFLPGLEGRHRHLCLLSRGYQDRPEIRGCQQLLPGLPALPAPPDQLDRDHPANRLIPPRRWDLPGLPDPPGQAGREALRVPGCRSR